MSSRSQRERKPTSKYLNFYTEGHIPSTGAVKKTKRELNDALTHKAVLQPKPKTKPESATKLVKNKDQLSGVVTHEPTPVKHDVTPGEIRRTGRQHKPNDRLKEFLKTSSDETRRQNTGNTSGSQNITSKRSLLIRTPSKVSKNKFVAAVSPMPWKERIKTPYQRSEHMSVELVDCFEGLTNDLAITHPTTSVCDETPSENFEILYSPSIQKVKSVPLKAKDHVSERVCFRNGVKQILDEGTTYLSEESPAKARPLGAKRNFYEMKTDSSEEPVPKARKLQARTVANTTKNKKSTKITTLVETVSIDRDQSRKTVTRNRKSKITKQISFRPKAPCKSSAYEEGANSAPLASSFSNHSGDANTQQKKIRSNPQLVRSKREVHPQEKDIKETLKKFLIMGTKVANAISETLKHNEEALLSKSSAFEKKCLSLVHALAKQGSDLEEDDMEKVLKLLDEEQEERRIYRQTFLESLRVSHLTNIALYSQMLRLLKTL